MNSQYITPHQNQRKPRRQKTVSEENALYSIYYSMDDIHRQHLLTFHNGKLRILSIRGATPRPTTLLVQSPGYAFIDLEIWYSWVVEAFLLDLADRRSAVLVRVQYPMRNISRHFYWAHSRDVPASSLGSQGEGEQAPPEPKGRYAHTQGGISALGEASNGIQRHLKNLEHESQHIWTRRYEECFSYTVS